MLSTHRVDSDCFSEVVGQLRFSTKLYVLFANRGRSSAAVYWLVYIYSFSTLYAFFRFFLYTKLSIATHTHTHKRGKRKSLVISFVLILILLAINQCQHRSVNSERERESICPFRFLWRVDVHHTPNLELFIEQLLFYLYLFIWFFNKKREEEEH